MRSYSQPPKRLAADGLIFPSKERTDAMSSNRPNGSSVCDPACACDHADPVGRLLKISDVCLEVGLSRAMVYRLITDAKNPFPKPIKIGNASRWSLIEIIEWKKRALSKRAR